MLTKPPKQIGSEPAEVRGELPVQGFDLQSIAGITPVAAMELNAMGIHTLDDLLQLSQDDLIAIKGIGERRAAARFPRRLVLRLSRRSPLSPDRK